MADRGGPGGKPGSLGGGGHGTDGHGQGGGEPCGGVSAGGRASATHDSAGRSPPNAPVPHGGRHARVRAGGAHGAEVRTSAGGATVEGRPRHARPDSASSAGSRGRARTRRPAMSARVL